MMRLLKYEFRALRAPFAFYMAVLLAIRLLCGQDAVMNLGNIFALATLSGVAILSLRFYQTIFGPLSGFAMALPVTKGQWHICPWPRRPSGSSPRAFCSCCATWRWVRRLSGAWSKASIRWVRCWAFCGRAFRFTRASARP